MPTPVYIAGAAPWRKQRGTRFGTDKEGKDWVELVYRGASASAVLWRIPWTTGTACPEPGFTHCQLVKPPTVRQDAIGFSTATLRFEGLSPLSGTAAEGTDATISHATEENEFSIYYKHRAGGKGYGFYIYNRVVVQASYIRPTRPTANLRYASKLNDDPDPVPTANGELKEPWFKDYTKLVPKVAGSDASYDYEVATNGRIIQWSQSAPDVFDVTEEHTKYIVGNIVDVGVA